MKLGDLIIQYRASHGLSQRQFASICGLSNGYISMLERGKNPSTNKPVTPTIPQLKKLATGMSISLMDLLDQVDDMPIDLNSCLSDRHTHFSDFNIYTATGNMVESNDSRTSYHITKERDTDFTEEEIDMIRKFRVIDERGQNTILALIEHEYENADDNETAAYEQGYQDGVENALRELDHMPQDWDDF